MFSEKAKRNKSILVKCVDKRIRIDGHRRCVEYNLIDLSKLLQKESDSWANQNIHRDWSSFNDNSHMKVIFTTGLASLNVGKRELAVNQSLIEVENKRFPASVLWHLLVNDSIFLWDWVLSETTCLLKFIQVLLSKVELLLQVLVVSLSCNC